MPKPAHSHDQMSLQSVWDMGRYLSRYPVAGVACEAPGTCKQCTPQITAICDGARGTTILYLNTHAACALAPASYLEHTPSCTAGRKPLLCPCPPHQRRSYATNQITAPPNSTSAAHLAMSPHAGGQPRGRSTTAKHLSSAHSVGPAQTEMIPPSRIARNGA